MIIFDPDKDESNRRKHRISLGRAAELEPFATVVDDRMDYGETRYRAFGFIDGRPYCLIFTRVGEDTRAISLRRARSKETRRYMAE